MKNKSLQEQLLNSGLTNSAKLKAVRSEKRKQHKQQRHSETNKVDEAKVLVQKKQEEQVEKDRLLNQLRQEQAVKKEIAAQIKQLVEQNRLEQDEDGVKYNFTDENKVKTVYLSDEVRNQLIQGRVAIVKSEQRYELVPLAIARKIEQRDRNCIVVINVPESEKHDDDPYAAFQVPDDLMW